MLAGVDSAPQDCHGVPMLFTRARLCLDPGITLVSARAVYRGKDGTRRTCCGFAAGPQPDECVARAGAEAWEKMLATADFVPTDLLKLGFPVFSFSGETTGRKAPADEILIRNPKLASPLVSASGLGLHVNARRALRHAFSELIERHLLCDFWYRDGKLALLDEEPLKGSHCLSYYTTVQPSGFCLAVLTGGSQPSFFAGSAVRSTLARARQAARLEAISLHTNLPMLGDIPPQERYPGDSAPRMRSLVGESAQRKMQHLERRLVSARSSFRERAFTLRENLAAIGTGVQSASFTLVNRHRNLRLYRAFIVGVLTKNECRARFPDVEPDPFC